jgi:hypothetical protein
MADIDDFGEIIAAYHRRSAECGELYGALAKAQGTFVPADRSGKNPHFRSTYATLEAVISASREGCAANGLAIMQLPGNIGENIAVTTILGHSSGQWIESTFYMAPKQWDAQGAGSVITYLRRYALLAVLGIAPEDDDGEAAVARPATLSGRPVSKAYPAVQPEAPPRKRAAQNGQEATENTVEETREVVLVQTAEERARLGSLALRSWYKTVGQDGRRVLSPFVDRLKNLAADADDLLRADSA